MGNVRAFRYELPQDFVPVLDQRFLPWTVRVAEVDADTEFLFKLTMVEQKNIIVERNGLHLGKPLFDAYERIGNGSG